MGKGVELYKKYPYLLNTLAAGGSAYMLSDDDTKGKNMALAALLALGGTAAYKNRNNIALLETKNWKEFYLHKLFDITMGNGIDANKTTDFDPKYNYVSRDSNGNGVVGVVDKVNGETPFPAGSMSVALGGSFLGSCFIQKEPFLFHQYTFYDNPSRDSCQIQTDR